MNLTQIINSVGTEIGAALDELNKQGITVISVDAEIETAMAGMNGGARFTRTVKVTGLKNRAIISGALMQANV